MEMLADRAGVSRGSVFLLESGGAVSVEMAIRLAAALSLSLEFELVDPRKRTGAPVRTVDLVHSLMGEVEARQLRGLSFPVGIDEPYQHYQFAGRADVIAWDLDARAVLHLENRTRFPDFQEMAGSFNSKKSYLGTVIADRIGIRRWASETHVIVALWSAEVLHSLRLRPESFRSLCPDPPDAFASWWAGQSPPTGVTSSLVVLDPLATGRQRPFIGLDEAIATAKPRHRGYAEVVAELAAQQPSG
jgi:transcriptional regulator with XRE-family HTH domain